MLGIRHRLDTVLILHLDLPHNSQYFLYFSLSYFLSFLLVETLESYLALKTGEDAIELSAQQITSCTPNPMHCGGTGGCSGSIPEIGFTYSHMMGIVT